MILRINTIKATLVFFCLLCSLVGSASSKNVVNIVAFNAENLFDTIDDVDNPRDDTYLPLAVKNNRQPRHNKLCEKYNRSKHFYEKQCKTLNWDKTTYHTKLKRYANVLKAMPVMPDIIVIAETENKQVLHDLVSMELSSEKFNIVHLDSSDKPKNRGIDVGILSKFSMVGTPSAHVIDFGRHSKDCGKTRDIVQAALQLPDGEQLHTFGVHFPSGRSPLICRVVAFQVLNKLVGALPKNSLVLAAGDFNINCKEASSETFSNLLRKGHWLASPLLSSGCAAPGSSQYKRTWSFLDMIIVSSELSPTRASDKNWFADLGSFGTLIVSPEQIMTDKKNRGFIRPRRFDPRTGRGVSDHFPVGIRLLARRN